MQIDKNSVVAIQYTLTNDEKEVLDSSEGREPLVYLHGADNIIPGLEAALVGKKEGDAVNVTVAPEEAYGPFYQERLQEVPREAFGEHQDLAPGMVFRAQTEDGEEQVVISEVTETTVTVNGNHPLAGQHLTFDVTIESVREATADELAHGHPHVEGSSCH
jgi:FKBP-type peptidyl-prolyl cis-trans isomerase SlyD